MKTLHIVSWFPNNEKPNEAPWIKRHIEAISSFCKNDIWHINTAESSSLRFFAFSRFGVKHWLIKLPSSRWFLIEAFSFLQMLVFSLVHRRQIKSADIINFHIAYPNLTYWKWLKPIFCNKPVVITEHWSAYHFNFGVKKELPRVQNIFHHGMPLITISDALRKDIEKLSGTNIKNYIIPNVVNTAIFKYEQTEISKQFFMVSQWKYPKDPFKVIHTFNEFIQEHDGYRLIIGGFGPQWEGMADLVKELDLVDDVTFLGIMSSLEIAREMNRSLAFIHLSDYETFSVVCAEAVCCGCPVIASKVGGIPEFVNEKNGYLLNRHDQLLHGLRRTQNLVFKRIQNAKLGGLRFNRDTVGKQYFNALKEIIKDHNA